MEKKLDLASLELCIDSYKSRWVTDQPVTCGLSCNDNDSYTVCQPEVRHPTFDETFFDKCRQAVKDAVAEFNTPGNYFVAHVSLSSGRFGYELAMAINRENKDGKAPN